MRQRSITWSPRRQVDSPARWVARWRRARLRPAKAISRRRPSVIKRIRVRYQLRGCPMDKQAAARRAHEHHAAKCPVYRSIGGCIDIATSLEFVAG
ncbi:MAG: hypothetical protein E6I24_09455 [Chloroflexi bacterium]|nr:MAG: hypothetical protein E6I24_09455 [Chloroflexota bacterium]